MELLIIIALLALFLRPRWGGYYGGFFPFGGYWHRPMMGPRPRGPMGGPRGPMGPGGGFGGPHGRF